MRTPSVRVVGFTVLATISALLLSGCQLREGPGSEYGDTQSMPAEKMASGQF